MAHLEKKLLLKLYIEFLQRTLSASSEKETTFKVIYRNLVMVVRSSEAIFVKCPTLLIKISLKILNGNIRRKIVCYCLRQGRRGNAYFHRRGSAEEEIFGDCQLRSFTFQ